jgi:hypothetical protein
MPPLKFDSPLDVVQIAGNWVIKTKGDLALDTGEELEELCIKIFHDNRTLAEGHGSDRNPTFVVTSGANGTWAVDSPLLQQPGQSAQPALGQPDEIFAVAAASAMTDGPEAVPGLGGAMSAYQWVQVVKLKVV